MKRAKTFDSLDKLGAYILKSNLKATEKIWDKVFLCDNNTWFRKETVTITF